MPSSGRAVFVELRTARPVGILACDAIGRVTRVLVFIGNICRGYDMRRRRVPEDQSAQRMWIFYTMKTTTKSL